MYLFYTPDIETSHFLSEEESAHCVRVLRYDRGDEILLTDGRGTTYHARITNPHPRHCEFEVLSQEKQEKTHNTRTIPFTSVAEQWRIYYSSLSFIRSAFSATCSASITPCISPSIKAVRL